MRRPAKGGTTHPTQQRPGMGYGRPLRPRPGALAPVDLLTDIQAYLRGERRPVTIDDTVVRDDRAPSELDLRS